MMKTHIGVVFRAAFLVLVVCVIASWRYDAGFKDGHRVGFGLGRDRGQQEGMEFLTRYYATNAIILLRHGTNTKPWVLHIPESDRTNIIWAE